MIENTNDYYLSFTDLLLEAEEDRRSLSPDKMGTYGIDILDSFTSGIFPDELVVVGSDTWMGKSELAYNIALSNAKKNKKVLLFSLEGNINEIAWRYTQQQISEVEKIKTQEYRTNKNKKYQQYAKDIMAEVYDSWRGENLQVFNKKAIPTFEFLVKLIETSATSFDMFIIDHLHYIQFWTRESEIEQIGKIMRKIKTMTDIMKKPVVIMSHLRKRTKDKDPTEQDLYWSSNIAKEANTIILISRMDLNNNEKRADGIQLSEQGDVRRYSGTKIIIEKSRVGMPVVTKLALVYDRRGKKYVNEYSSLIKEESQASYNDVLDF